MEKIDDDIKIYVRDAHDLDGYYLLCVSTAIKEQLGIDLQSDTMCSAVKKIQDIQKTYAIVIKHNTYNETVDGVETKIKIFPPNIEIYKTRNNLQQINT